MEGGSTETPAGVPYAAFGDTLGAEGVFLGEPRAATAVMIRPGVLIRARRASLLAVLAQDPQLFDRLVLDDSVRSRLSLDDLPTAAGGEFRVALYRRHWIVLARAMVLPLLLLAGLMTIASLASALGAVGSERGPAVALLLVLTAVGVPAAVAVWSFFDYYHDVLIVTNRRLVHVERTPFVDAQRTEAMFDRVQDVTSLTPGVGARLLGYGTVIVQTASARGSIAFDHVPRPDDAIPVTQWLDGRIVSCNEGEMEVRFVTRPEGVAGDQEHRRCCAIRWQDVLRATVDGFARPHGARHGPAEFRQAAERAQEVSEKLGSWITAAQQ